MGDLKTNWTDPLLSDVGIAGETISTRGTDPLVDLNAGGANGLMPLWEQMPVPTPSGEETANSVSGFPSTPSRVQPTDQPPSPPTLQDRSPGIIDQQ